jgi:hypothetical protein
VSEARSMTSVLSDTTKRVVRPSRLVVQYRREHRNPINHFLHVAVGWPMMAAAVILIPFRPLWSLGLFLGSYAVMFSGHFLFERNTPTIFKHPGTPFVVALAVIRGLWGGVIRLAAPERVRYRP